MVTVAELREDIIRWRDVDRQDRVIESTKNDRAHDAISAKLDTMNGTQRAHATTIAGLCKTVEHHDGDIDDVRGLIKTLFSKYRQLDKSVALRWGYAAGAATAVMAVLNYIVMPVIKHLMGG